MITKHQGFLFVCLFCLSIKKYPLILLKKYSENKIMLVHVDGQVWIACISEVEIMLQKAVRRVKGAALIGGL